MRQESEIIEIIKSAFKPLKCEAGTHDYNFIWYRVYLPNGNTIIRNECVDDLKVATLSGDDSRFHDILDTRASIGQRGIALDEWSLPQAS